MNPVYFDIISLQIKEYPLNNLDALMYAVDESRSLMSHTSLIQDCKGIFFLVKSNSHFFNSIAVGLDSS